MDVEYRETVCGVEGRKPNLWKLLKKNSKNGIYKTRSTMNSHVSSSGHALTMVKKDGDLPSFR